MAKVRTFDTGVLQKHYEQAPHLDLSWLTKASRHQYRWRCTKNRWHTAQRQIRSGEVLAKSTRQNTPQDMYVSTSAWLNPVNLPRLKDTTVPHPVLIDHLIVFDIDIPPFCRANMEKARRAAVSLLDWVEEECQVERIHIVFSGSKGFHLVFRDKDRSFFGIPDPRERETAVREARKALLARVLDAGHPVDAGITADTRRIIRLPGSLHGSTGWQCAIISEEQLRSPFKSWMKHLPRHAAAVPMPRKAKLGGIKPGKGKTKQEPTEPSPYTSIELSTHVTGTKDRNAIVAWLPRSWGSIDRTVKKVQELLEQHALGSALLWTDGKAVLMMIPRAYPRVKAAKVCRKIGLPRTAESMLANDHHWVRISARQWQKEGWDQDLEPLCVLRQTDLREVTTPWSASHLEMADRLELPLNVADEACSGSKEPAIRIVKRS